MLYLFYFFNLIWLSAYYIYAPTYFSYTTVVVILLIVLTTLFLTFYIRKEPIRALQKNFFKHSSLVVFGYLIVHFQANIDYLAGNIDENNFYIWINKGVVTKSLILSSIGLLSFCFGYVFFKNNTKRFSKSIQYKVVPVSNILKLFATIALVLYFYFINPLYLLGNYGVIDMGVVSSYIAPVFEAIMLAIIIQHSLNITSSEDSNISFIYYLSRLGFITCFLLLVYLASVLLSGDRGPLIFFSLAIIGSYIFVTKKKLKLSALLYVFIGAAIITFLGKVRALDRSLNFIDKIKLVLESKDGSRFGYTSFLPQTQELSASIRCLHYSVYNVPKFEPYMYGRFQIQQLTSIIPFSSSINEMLYDNNEFRYGGSPNYITWLDQGSYIYSGTGTTIIADFYLDFGLIGVLIGMFLVGYLIRYSELVLFNNTLPSLFAYTFSLTYLCNSIYLSRSTFLIVLKIVCWTFFFLQTNKYLSYSKK